MTKTIFKTVLLVLVIGLTSVNVMGQSPKDYYIPKQSNFNKASFYTPSKTGGRTDMTRVIYYVDNGDGTFDNTDAKMFQGKPSAISTQTVMFTATEVKMTKSVSTSMFETNKKQTYEPARTLLKMPAAGQTASWTIPSESGDKQTVFTSSWTTVTIDGASKKAIKVVSQYTGWKSKSVSYYVEGIGLNKTEFIGEDGITIPLENFDGLSFEPTTR